LPDLVSITINGRKHKVENGTMVAAVLLAAGIPCRRSSIGQPRTALCGMGICFECRATVDGVPHRRTCQLLCYAGMVVETP
jgi:sarcosine oxidase subunit alpha